MTDDVGETTGVVWLTWAGVDFTDDFTEGDEFGVA